MKPWRVAKKEPAKPANMAPQANAVSLVMVVLMPSERQAISSSRSASQARPTGRRRRRTGHAAGDQREDQDDVVEADDAMDGRELEAEDGGEAVSLSIEGNAEQRRPRDVGDAGRAAGEVRPVEQDEPDDLAEGEGDDGEVVAAQPQHREAEDHAPGRGEDAGERQADPEAPAEIVGEEREGIGADRVEGDVAEVEEAGVADDDVEAPAEHHIGEHDDARGR